MKIQESIDGFRVDIYCKGDIYYDFYLDSKNYKILMEWLESDYNHIEIGNKYVLILDDVIRIHLRGG